MKQKCTLVVVDRKLDDSLLIPANETHLMLHHMKSLNVCQICIGKGSSKYRLVSALFFSPRVNPVVRLLRIKHYLP